MWRRSQHKFDTIGYIQAIRLEPSWTNFNAAIYGWPYGEETYMNFF